MNILREHDRVLKANERLPKPSIPELPKTKQELTRWMLRFFKILWEGKLVSERGMKYHPGGIAITDLKLQCPFCSMEFEGVRRSGCFMNRIFPLACPNCSFPNNILEAVMVLRQNEQIEGL